ncbi:MAG: hypothetical protein WCB04_04080 [Mycobacteriales bacterium]
MRIFRALVVSTAAAALVGSMAVSAVADPSEHSSPNRQLVQAYQATGKYHNLAIAKKDGYGEFADLNGITCIAMPGMGAMGIHYVNGGYVGDPTLNVRHPEALVYRPGSDGRLHLAALEYIVVKSAWDANHARPPSLFGQKFNFTDSPNRYGLPPFYSLHVWLWQYNPAGLFQMWNPRVHCPST